jgi:hypothetical protein
MTREKERRDSEKKEKAKRKREKKGKEKRIRQISPSENNANFHFGCNFTRLRRLDIQFCLMVERWGRGLFFSAI